MRANWGTAHDLLLDGRLPGRHGFRGADRSRLTALDREPQQSAALWGIAFDLVLAAIFIYAPPFQSLLGTAPLSLDVLVFALPFPFVVWGADELRRFLPGRRVHASGPPDRDPMITVETEPPISSDFHGGPSAPTRRDVATKPPLWTRRPDIERDRRVTGDLSAPPLPAFAGGERAITTTPVVGTPRREYPDLFVPEEELEDGELRVTVLGSGNPG